MQYEGKTVNLTLANKFWYKGKIISVSEEAVIFISEDGRNITIEPSLILLIFPIGANGK